MGEPEAGRDGLTAAWSRLHHGIDPRGSVLLNGWLHLMWRVARPLARRGVPPTVVTVFGAVAALAAVSLAPLRVGGTVAALVLVIASGVADSLDGAVAVVSDRATEAGRVVDAAADRVADCAYAAVFWRCGAPWWLALIAAGLSLFQEGLRAWWARQGRPSLTVTVAERPTRVICAALALLAFAVSPAHWPATVCANVWILLTVVSLIQLGAGRVAMRHPAGSTVNLSGPPDH